jgi:hypothetical protein
MTQMFTPPPYSNVNGIYRQDDKHTEISFAEYDGNARPGELVVDTTNYTLWIGNAEGYLNQVAAGSGNGVPGGPIGAVQFNQNNTNFGGSANLVWDFANANLSIGGNVLPEANVTYDLGSPTLQWKSAYFAGNTIYLNNVPLSLGSNNSLNFNGNPLVSASGSNGNMNVSNITAGGAVSANTFLGDGSQLTGIYQLTNGVNSSNLQNYFSLDTSGNVHICENTGSTSGAILWDAGGSFLYEDEILGLSARPWNGLFSVGTGSGSAGALDGDINAAGNITANATLTGLSGVFNNGDGFNQVAKPQISLSYDGGLGWDQWIHTRHNGSSATNNAIDFYTNDGTQAGVFPTNAILGATITNGKLGVNNLYPTATLDVIGTGNFTGTVTAQTFIGDGGNLVNVQGAYGNSNVAAYLPTYPGALNSVSSLISGNVLSNSIASTSTIMTVDPSNDGSPLTGDLYVLGNLSVTGNVTYVGVSSATTANLQWISAINANNAVQASGGGLQVGPIGTPFATWTYSQPANSWVSNIAIQATGGISANGPLSTVTDGYFSGNIIAATLAGNGGNISNIQGANVVGVVSAASVAGTVTTNAQPNITSVGTLTSLHVGGLISASGAVTASGFTGPILTNAQPNITSVGTLSNLNVAGNIRANTVVANGVQLYANTIATSSANLIIDPLNDSNPLTGNAIVLGNLSITGNLTYVDVSTAITSNLVWAAAVSATTGLQADGGGLTVGNVNTPIASWTYDNTANAWLSNIGISSVGSVSASAFIGDGGNLANIQYSNVVGAYGNANVSDYLASNINTAGISTQGTISAGSEIGMKYAPTDGGYIDWSDGASNDSYIYVYGSDVSLGSDASKMQIYAAGNIQLNPTTIGIGLTLTQSNVFCDILSTATAAETLLGYTGSKTNEIILTNSISLAGNVTSQYIVNTAIEPRVFTLSAGGVTTLTPDSSKSDQWNIPNLSGNVTVDPDSNTAFDGQKWTWRFYSTTAFTLTWNSQYRPFGVTLPSTVAVNTNVYVGMIWNATDTAWDVVSVATQTTPNPVSGMSSS